MKRLLLLKWLRNVSIAKKLYFTVGIMALLIAVELFTLWFAVSTLSSVRAYVGGEGLWSKAQKDAIYHLEKYGHSRNEEDYAQFLQFMQVPQGDHKARLEMLKPAPDMDVARQGFIEGRNHPNDVDGMIHLFGRFYTISYIKKAITIWTAADSISTQLLPIGEQLHAEINSPAPSPEKINSTLRDIGPINAQLTQLEDDFSYTLGEGSRWLENLIMKLLFSIALTVEITGLLLTISVSRGIQKGLKEIIGASVRIAKGDFSARAKKYSQDEIGALADSLNRMTGELEHHVNERKNAELTLRQSEAQLAMAQQLAHIGSWEWNLADNAMQWSEELYNIYGLSIHGEPITYEKIASMTHPADKDYISKIVADSRRTRKPFDFYHRIVRTDNKVRTLHARGEVIANDKGVPVKMIGTNQDVTDRFYEDELEKLAMAATKSNNSVVIASASGVIEWVNEGFTKLTGYTLEDVRHTHGELLRKGGATGLSQQTEFYDTLINQKIPVAYEGKNYTKTGEEYWVITTLTPVIGKDGKVERIIAIDSDITERKLIEEDLILANKIAEHSLKKGNKALNDLLKAKKELEDSMRVKEQFLAKMSHEIRTPMNAITGLTEILLDSNVTAEQKECIDAIKLSSDNLLSIINDILDFSKLSSGKVSLELLPFSPKEVIDGVLQTLSVAAGRKGIKLELELHDLPAYLMGDPVRLRQILLNLASNALKFTEKGSVTIVTDVLVEEKDAYTIEFIVKDTGIGIPDDRLSSIFESFTQASNETSRKYGGTGLGLTIVNQLVELQGGSVTVESKLHEGSSFSVILPFKKCAPEDIPVRTAPSILTEEKFDGARVLLAEDNEMNQMLASKVLGKWGFELDIADNGKEAIEKLTHGEYDIILMDIQMPEMDGYETTKYIRGNMGSPKSRIPIIAMTAHAIVGEAEKCIALGMDDYISKPFNQRTLYEKMGRLLKKKQDASPAGKNGKNGKNGNILAPGKNYDLSYLTAIGEGNREFMKKMILAFLNQTPRIIADMTLFLQEKKWKELRGAAHKMKPSLDFMGIHSLRETIATLEHYSAEQKNLGEIPGMVEAVQKTCTDAMHELQQEVNTW